VALNQFESETVQQACQVLKESEQTQDISVIDQLQASVAQLIMIVERLGKDRIAA